MPKRTRKSATILDIGKRLGLSAMTVSRALREHPDVHAETRRKVIECAEKLNYRPNRWARSLVTNESHMVGIVIPDISHTFFPEITLGVEETIDPKGYDLLLCHSRGDPEREKSEIDMLIGSRVDGLIVASEQPEDSPGTFAELQRQGVPFVLIDRFFRKLNCPCVRVDDTAVGRIATEHLIELGHTSIAHIQDPNVSTALLRQKGYLETLRRHNLPLRPEWIVSGGFDLGGGSDAMKRLLSVKPRPTAVFATNDPSGIGAVHASWEAGLRVPEDLSVIGAGDIEGANHPHPFLTTVGWPHLELGRIAARMLLKLIASETPLRPRKRILSPQLVVRQSTAAPS